MEEQQNSSTRKKRKRTFRSKPSLIYKWELPPPSEEENNSNNINEKEIIGNERMDDKTQ